MLWILGESALLLWSTFLQVAAESAVFPVYWNVFSGGCKERIPLEDYDIIHNKDQRFFGEEIVILYDDQIDGFPYMDGEREKYGGIPQRVSLHKWDYRFQQYIEDKIPNKGFRGIAVVDFERWRATYDSNWGKFRVYQKESDRYLISLQTPECCVDGKRPCEYGKKVCSYLLRNPAPRKRDAHFDRISRLLFDMAAKQFWQRSLQILKYLRPQARIGLYILPECNSIPDNTAICGPKFREYNERLEFVYSLVDVLLPSLYMNQKNQPEKNYATTYAKLAEAMRISTTDAAGLPRRRRIPIIPYMSLEYTTDRSTMLDSADLCTVTQLARDFGVDGLIVWSTSNGMSSRCPAMAEYVARVFGPAILRIRSSLASCSSSCFSSRCVGDLPSPQQAAYATCTAPSSLRCGCSESDSRCWFEWGRRHSEQRRDVSMQ